VSPLSQLGNKRSGDGLSFTAVVYAF